MFIQILNRITHRTKRLPVLLAEVVHVTTTVIDQDYDYAHREDILLLVLEGRKYLVNTAQVGTYQPGMFVRVRRTHQNPVYPIQLVS